MERGVVHQAADRVVGAQKTPGCGVSNRTRGRARAPSKAPLNPNAGRLQPLARGGSRRRRRRRAVGGRFRCGRRSRPIVPAPRGERRSPGGTRARPRRRARPGSGRCRWSPRARPTSWGTCRPRAARWVDDSTYYRCSADRPPEAWSARPAVMCRTAAWPGEQASRLSPARRPRWTSRRSLNGSARHACFARRCGRQRGPGRRA